MGEGPGRREAEGPVVKDFACESSEFNGPKCRVQCARCKPQTATIQLKWSDEKNWRDIRDVPLDRVEATLEQFRREDTRTTAHYKHSFHGEYRVKP